MSNGSAVPALSAQERTTLQRRVRLIVAFTILYNIAEAVISLIAGGRADSTALVGFGLDSVVEVASAAVVAWQFSRKDPERYEQQALRGIGIAFFLLAAYVAVISLAVLFSIVTQPRPSTLGIIIAIASVVIMPTIAAVERTTGRRLNSAAVVADSRQLMVCWYLSVALLVGLLLNTWLGWWWADPLAGLCIAYLALREGREAFAGDSCATTGMRVMLDPAGAKAPACGDCCHDD
ncbi:cation transporter [Corynebacterium choanae]|uniref:Cation efflux family protein n=1 Tax=Corynebacterium choanae TaxID=1862358 RepID=A0A3G6J8W3_9CORY|nr:cation transporter [Corynebacterium choanae]AZA12454.1 Cation efflux family protein [Corynebacterium choanae]